CPIRNGFGSRYHWVCRLPTWRAIQDFANVDEIHLSPEAFMGSIDANLSTIPAQSRMRIDPILTVADVHASLALELGQRHEPLGGPVKQKDVLKAVNGISV